MAETKPPELEYEAPQRREPLVETAVHRAPSWAMLWPLPFLVIFAVVLLRTAWLCDDAYITFRTVDNVAHGYGPVWNTDERVQAFTHPLWMLVLTASYFATNELYYTPIFLSIVFSVLAVWLATAGRARDAKAAALGILIFMCSKAFVDYATSGLENPLTYLLLSAFVLVFLTRDVSYERTFALALLAGLLTLNRMDTILLCLPALAVAFFQKVSLRNLGLIALGFMPFIAWEIFAIIYYGFPFPNTAYAKLGAGIPKPELWLQGVYYFANSIWWDPLTLIVIALGCLTPLFRREWKALAVSCGVGLYLLYVVYIGGDFMSGRFFAAPLLASVMLLVAVPVNAIGFAAAAVGVLTIGLMSPFSTLRSGPDYPTMRNRATDGHGIADERQFYYQSTGLVANHRGARPPSHKYIRQGQVLRAKGEAVVVHGSAGFRGFFGGPKPHIVDYYALADPLLARLPAKYAENWRIGHFARVIPEGYLPTLQTGKNQFANEALGRYYEALRRITRGPIFSLDRWEAMVTMNTGGYDHLIDGHAFRFPNAPAVPLEMARGRRTFRVDRAGLTLTLEQPVKAARVVAQTQAPATYRVDFLRDGLILSTSGPMEHAATTQTITAPLDQTPGGYDRVRIVPVPGATLVLENLALSGR